MKARELMSSPAVSVGVATPVREAAALLTEYGFASLPVTGEDGSVVGVITEHDALLESGSPSAGDERTAGEVMSTPAWVVAPDIEASDVARRMLADRVRCIPVVEDGRLVGVISRRDLLRSLVRRDDVIAAHLRGLLDGYTGTRSHWNVRVTGGVVTVTGEFRDAAERRIVEALVRTEPGVVRVELDPVDVSRQRSSPQAQR
ncbi:CBS domain-containing protein [Haloechinothrix sp. LS1_15]|uniref:CBS domain-containing protein n=1 Tax=Haloechinothrix sp. LS1_15 TaxID=2652248 RepID=UPI002946A94D|nr:CBS domain-containing protein [Haloechinothrix sp. LS1_15]MDV6014215.1 CBS domain-containing protein [Haloechinothrix sp. LS1_15]